MAFALVPAASGSAALAAGDAAEAPGVPTDSIASSLPYGGDPGGVRKYLGENGVTYGLILTSEGLANVSGGLRTGAVSQGKLEVFMGIDFEKLAGIRGLSAFANAFQIHGSGGISRDLVGNFNTISNIEALPTTRLSEAWVEQKLTGTVSLRVGQLAADTEFFISDASTFFMNSDWPAITALNLPSGGPAYPLSTPGVRLKVEASEQVTLLAALFNGDPSGPGPEDAEIKNRHGLNFRTQDPPLVMGEVQYRYNQDKAASGLAGILRFGGWYHFGDFDSQRFDAGGLSIANPLGSGIAARLRGTSGIYGVVDQQVYRPAGGGPDSGVSVFSRISGSPSDRNPIEFYLDGGVVFSGMLPARPDDKFGATFLFANISSAARALDRDAIAYSGIAMPVRDFEMTLALAYQAQIVPGWTLQPEVHYVIHPGGNVSDPGAASPATPIRDATVFALRSLIKY